MGRPPKIEESELLAVARAVFLERGPVGASKEIARRAGISEAALFQRYGTRDALFYKALMPPPFAAGQLVSEAAAKASSPRAALMEISRSALAYFRGVVGSALTLMAHPDFRIEEMARRHQGHNPGSTLIKAIADWLTREAKVKRLRCPDPRASADLIVAALHSVALFEHLGIHESKAGDARALAAIDTYWPALAPKERPHGKRGD